MLVRSLIKLDKGPFLKEHFDAVKGLKYISPNTQIYPDDPWNIYLPISPEMLFQVLTRDLPGEAVIEIASDDDGDISIDIIGFGEFKTLYTDEGRVISPQRVKSGSMEVFSNHRGIGKTILRNYIEFGVLTGREGFEINAASTNGAYSWARLGFPLDLDDKAPNIRLSRKLNERLERVCSLLPYTTYMKILDKCELEGAFDLSDIADEKFDLLSSFPDGELESMTGDIFINLAEGFHEQGRSSSVSFEKANTEVSRIKELKNFCMEHNKPLGIGLYLLYGASYSGYLDFSDERAMCRIEKYVDGFETIALVYDAPQQPAVRQRKAMALTA